MKRHQLSPAFSMLELIFVIVILGIVASIGSEMIAKVYESYIIQRAEHKATIKTELAATQIANRLASAIPGTVLRRNALIGGTIEDIDDYMDLAGDSYIALQWVGADTDSFNANNKPGWSGFCDIDDSNITSLSTPGSDLNSTRTIINNLSSGTPIPRVYFPYDINSYSTNITSSSTNVIELTGTGASHIVEHYKLAWTSYALTVENGDLYLHYDFTPQTATNITNTSRSLLMKNISTFKFKGSGRTIRFKICREERISEDINITSCKEKAVF